MIDATKEDLLSMSEQDQAQLLLAVTTLLLQMKEVVVGLTNKADEHFPPNRPFTKDEAAQYLGINPDTLCKWARQGRIAYCRLGEGARAPMRFRKKDLDAFLSASRIPTVEEVSNR